MVVKQMSKRKRLFTKRQKRILKLVSGNYCENCGRPLKGKFHADHKIPHSKGGPTILKNAQALCVSCNLRKGNKIKLNVEDRA